jgi:glutamyl-tRNA reductase
VARQVKDAYARSVACGKILHRLFQRAFGVAAALRGAWGPGRPPSIPGLMAKRWLRSLPGSREGARADRDRPPEEIGASRERDLSALVVGAGAMAEATLAVLGACRVERTLTARRIERARALAEARGDERTGGPAPDRGIRLLPWERFRSALGAFDAVFLCTGSEEPLLGEADLEGILPSGRTPTICDLGQPPQVAREARGRLPYLSLDDLSREAAAASTAHAKALERLSEEAERAAEALYSEVLRRADDAWRRIALARASAVARERAEAEARRAGVPPELLERFAESVLSAYLRPLVTAPAPHSERAFRILAGVTGALAGEPLPPGRQGGE